MKNDKNQNKALSQTSVSSSFFKCTCLHPQVNCFSSNCSYCNRQIVKDLTSRDLGIVKNNVTNVKTMKKSKQIEYTKEEQEAIYKCITTISSILIDKKDKGFDSPVIKGSVNVKDENIKITFEILAESIERQVF